MPNKQGGSVRIPKFNKQGVRIKGGVGICVTTLHDYTRTERKIRVVIKHRAKTYTEVLYFALNIGRE